MVGRGGFEPPKAEPTDLQSVPFGHSGISPAFEAITPPELTHLKKEIPLKNMLIPRRQAQLNGAGKGT